MVLVCILCSFFYIINVKAKDEKKEVVSICIQNQQGEHMKQVDVIITDANEQIKTYTSDHLGYVTLENLSIGEYHIDVQTPRGYKVYKGQAFYVTQYNQASQIEMTIQLHEKEKTLVMKCDAWLLFLCLCNVMMYFILYIFYADNSYNFTQSFDDSMI